MTIELVPTLRKIDADLQNGIFNFSLLEEILTDKKLRKELKYSKGRLLEYSELYNNSLNLLVKQRIDSSRRAFYLIEENEFYLGFNPVEDLEKNYKLLNNFINDHVHFKEFVKTTILNKPTKELAQLAINRWALIMGKFLEAHDYNDASAVYLAINDAEISASISHEDYSVNSLLSNQTYLSDQSKQYLATMETLMSNYEVDEHGKPIMSYTTHVFSKELKPKDYDNLVSQKQVANGFEVVFSAPILKPRENLFKAMKNPLLPPSIPDLAPYDTVVERSIELPPEDIVVDKKTASTNANKAKVPLTDEQLEAKRIKHLKNRQENAVVSRIVTLLSTIQRANKSYIPHDEPTKFKYPIYKGELRRILSTLFQTKTEEIQTLFAQNGFSISYYPNHSNDLFTETSLFLKAIGLARDSELIRVLCLYLKSQKSLDRESTQFINKMFEEFPLKSLSIDPAEHSIRPAISSSSTQGTLSRTSFAESASIIIPPPSESMRRKGKDPHPSELIASEMLEAKDKSEGNSRNSSPPGSRLIQASASRNTVEVPMLYNLQELNPNPPLNGLNNPKKVEILANQRAESIANRGAPSSSNARMTTTNANESAVPIASPTRQSTSTRLSERMKSNLDFWESFQSPRSNRVNTPGSRTMSPHTPVSTSTPGRERTNSLVSSRLTPKPPLTASFSDSSLISSRSKTDILDETPRVNATESELPNFEVDQNTELTVELKPLTQAILNAESSQSSSNPGKAQTPFNPELALDIRNMNAPQSSSSTSQRLTSHVGSTPRARSNTIAAFPIAKSSPKSSSSSSIFIIKKDSKSKKSKSKSELTEPKPLSKREPTEPKPSSLMKTISVKLFGGGNIIGSSSSSSSSSSKPDSNREKHPDSPKHSGRKSMFEEKKPKSKGSDSHPKSEKKGKKNHR